MQQLLLLSPEEQAIRLGRLRSLMRQAGMASMVISSNTNLFYLTGRIFSGYALVTLEGEPWYFVKRPVQLLAPNTVSVRKPEAMPSELKIRGIDPASLLPMGLELGRLTYQHASRIMQAFGLKAPAKDADSPDHAKDATPLLMQARAVKTEHEIELMAISGRKHAQAYAPIPQMLHEGITDIDLEIDIEAELRRHGCLGLFRIAGEDMETHMGSLLAGDNADAPSPYDFAMGGAGADPSLPIGADGTVLKPGMTVMVDLCGNFTGYMTDMSRTYAIGSVDELAAFAHQTSIAICRAVEQMARPGVEARAIYELAASMAEKAGLAQYFMGHNQQAGFVGHGVGIEINELPVLAPRSRDVLQAGNAIALEPKFVIPGTGPVGIENTYIVRDDCLQCITNAPEPLIKAN